MYKEERESTLKKIIDIQTNDPNHRLIVGELFDYNISHLRWWGRGQQNMNGNALYMQ